MKNLTTKGTGLVRLDETRREVAIRESTSLGQNILPIKRTLIWPYDPEPFESEDHDNDEIIYNETIIYQ